MNSLAKEVTGYNIQNPPTSSEDDENVLSLWAPSINFYTLKEPKGTILDFNMNKLYFLHIKLYT